MNNMEPEILYGTWYECERNGETEWTPEEAFIPADYVGHNVTKHENYYGARYQMPGYLDATEWSAFETLEEARDYLLEDTDTFYCGMDLEEDDEDYKEEADAVWSEYEACGGKEKRP